MSVGDFANVMSAVLDNTHFNAKEEKCQKLPFHDYNPSRVTIVYGLLWTGSQLMNIILYVNDIL